MTNNGCQQCGKNTFSADGASSCTNCSEGMVSAAGSTSDEDCFFGKNGLNYEFGYCHLLL